MSNTPTAPSAQEPKPALRKELFDDAPSSLAPKEVACRALVVVQNDPRRVEPKPTGEFDWREIEEDIVQRDYRKVAVYENPHGDICIRQERSWDDDDDTWIVIAKDGLPRLLTKLESLL
jgi:hypothetical protein